GRGPAALGGVGADVAQRAGEVGDHELPRAAGQRAREVARAAARVEDDLVNREPRAAVDPLGRGGGGEERAAVPEAVRLAGELAADDVVVGRHRGDATSAPGPRD